MNSGAAALPRGRQALAALLVACGLLGVARIGANAPRFRLDPASAGIDRAAEPDAARIGVRRACAAGAVEPADTRSASRTACGAAARCAGSRPSTARGFNGADGAGRSGRSDGQCAVRPRSTSDHRRAALAHLSRKAGCDRRLPAVARRARRGANLRAAAWRLRHPCQLRSGDRGEEGSAPFGHSARILRAGRGRRAVRGAGRRQPHSRGPDHVQCVPRQPVRGR